MLPHNVRSKRTEWSRKATERMNGEYDAGMGMRYPATLSTGLLRVAEA